MLYDSSTSTELHAWLVKTLEPICDAEPEALATYILALLKNDVPEGELRNEVIKQLDEFFEDGANSFVDTLFAALRSKSYVPYASASASYDQPSEQAQDIGIPIPLDLLTSAIPTSPGNSRKRSHEDDDREAHRPPKGPRLGNDAYFNRHGYANGGNQSDNWQRSDYGMNGHGPRQNGRPILPRGVCRDYHLKGFCSRGAMCKYSHDDAAITPQVPFGGSTQMGGSLPFMPMYEGLPFGMNGVQGQAYDPNEPQMDMRGRQGHQRVPTMPRADDQAMHGHGELPVVQDLTPASVHGPSVNGAHAGPSASAGGSPDVPMHSPPSQAQQTPQTPAPSIRPQRGGNRGRGRGGRGAFGDHASFGDQNENKTIVVEKIPEEHLSLEAVNNWFKRFGTVTNVAVDVSGGKALVSFSTHDEAFAAWKAEEAVFNNRFVKIFWHRPMAGQGSAGAKALQASAPLVANLASREAGVAEVQQTPKPAPALATPSSSAKTKTSNSSLAALQARQQLLEKQIAEQKELMGKLSKATPEEKKEIMTRLRRLDSEMKAPTKPTPPTPSTSTEDDKEKKKKMLLDMELDMHAKTTEENGVTENGDESSENLQEKLAKLREEAKALGITDVTAQAYSPAYRGYRGRGRGRGAFRGMRGAPQRLSNMRLDNRPKALLLKGLSAHDPDVVQNVRSFYEAVGHMASLDVLDDDSLVARFTSRAVAEQALAKGSNIPSAGSVKISWFTDVQPTKPAASTPASDKKSSTFADDRPTSPRPEDMHDVHDTHSHDDSGWGDEDGMGMF